jgi:hypothetical protein
LATAASGQVNLTSNRYDSNRTAANLNERTLSPANVSTSTFGKLWSYSVDGAVFAQPLYVQGVNIGGANRNVLYVATMHDVMYAFDADRANTVLWKRDFRGPGVTAASHGFGAVLGDAWGVLSTPVIDLGSNRMFVVAATRENSATVCRIHSIDLRTGADTITAVAITASARGISLDFAHGIQRPGLVAANGQIYIAFGGNPLDNRPYHGWILTYDMNSLHQTGVFVTTTNDGGAVWQSGGAPPIDGGGNVYYLTGNGFTGGFDGITNFGETLLKMKFQTGALSLADWFTPSNWGFFDKNDLDLSCNAPMLIPGTELVAFGSKNATVYLAHASALGKIQPGDHQLAQVFHVGTESFTSPAQGYPGILIGSAPAMASFNNRVYVAFQANDPTNKLFVTSAADGVNFTSPAVGYPGILIGSAPAMAAFNGRLYVAFQANDSSHKLFVTSSADGVNFTSPAVGYPGILIGSAPAMAAFNGRLYVAFQANDSSHKLFVTSSADGVNFTSPAVGYPGILIGSAPAMTAFNGRLYISFQANDPSHKLFVTSSADGVNFTSPAVGYPGILIGSSPAMTAFNNRLYVSFQANDAGHQLFVTSSADGTSFTSPALGYPGILIGSAPAMTSLNSRLFVGFQANDPGHALFVSGSSETGNTQVFNDGNRIIGLAYWQRSSLPPLLYAWPGNDTLASFPFQGGRFVTAQAHYGAVTGNGEPSIALSLSANGEQSGTGVIWAARTPSNRDVGSPGVLHAFHAETLRELWNSTMKPGDGIGALAKFVIPVVANGRVYVPGDSGAVNVFGNK